VAVKAARGIAVPATMTVTEKCLKDCLRGFFFCAFYFD
jgi:hypothetical protein